MKARRPAGIVPVAALAIAFVALPLVGLLWKAPWRSTWDVLDSHDALTALRLSLVTSIAATFVAVVLGLPLAWVLARIETPARPFADGRYSRRVSRPLYQIDPPLPTSVMFA